MAAISTWSKTAASNNAASPDGYPEGMNASGLNDSDRETLAAIRTWYEDAEYRDWGHTVTQASTTTFLVATDVTAIYTTGRRIRCADASTLYGNVTSSSYGAPNTTVTVSLDSGNLSGSLTAVALGPDPTNGTSRLINPDINEEVAMTATSTELNILDGATLTTAELNYVDGVTSAIQTQINTKAPIDDPAFTGGGKIGTVTTPADGAFATENGLYHGTNRNNRTVILDTPELITSTPTTGAWTTVNNTTLATATATAAIIRCIIESTSGSAATTDKAEGGIGLRKTGSGLGITVGTIVCYTEAQCSVVGQDNTQNSASDAHVNLDASYDFDYYASDITSGGGSNSFDIYLVGYIQNA